MTRSTTAWITGIGLLGVVVAITLVALLAQSPPGGFGDSATTLAFITATAIGIERTIEAMWTIVGSTVGSYWPLGAVRRQIDDMVEDLNLALKPFHEEVTQALTELTSLNARSAAWIQSADAEIGTFNKRFDQLQELAKKAPDNQRVQLLAATAAQHVGYLREKYGDIRGGVSEAANAADTAIGGLQDFVESFKDNPGRRLISLFVGTIMGLAVAGLFGLDLFQAALNVDGNDIDHPRLNIILSGLIIGLGSSPTHEVIRSIQEFKKGQKGSNVGRPKLGTN